jgi:hypothetical protein
MSNNNTKIASVSTVLLTSLGLYGSAFADPLPGEVLKFQQLPINNMVLPSTVVPPPVFQGRNEVSTAYQGVNSQGQTVWNGGFVADDFADNFNSPVVHLTWWGGYLNNPNNTPLTQFLVSFESDVPAQAGVISHPGTPLLNQIVTAGPLAPGNGAFTETLINPSTGLYKYNAELHLGQEFQEQKDTVYWLKVVALTADPNLSWGWHNRDYTVQDVLASPVPVPGETLIGPASQPMWHFQDDGVRGAVNITDLGNSLSVNQPFASMGPLVYQEPADGIGGIGGYSEDLAFALYTSPVPEPAMFTSIAIVGGALLMRRRRR